MRSEPYLIHYTTVSKADVAGPNDLLAEVATGLVHRRPESAEATSARASSKRRRRVPAEAGTDAPLDQRLRSRLSRGGSGWLGSVLVLR